MKLADVMIAWTPIGAQMRTAGLVAVDAHPDTTGWSARYMHAVGACDAEFIAGGDAERLAILFRAFHAMVVRDGILPEDAHEALLAIDEYRREIAPDIEGAEPLA
jgi:hypothetical protein